MKKCGIIYKEFQINIKLIIKYIQIKLKIKNKKYSEHKNKKFGTFIE